MKPHIFRFNTFEAFVWFDPESETYNVDIYHDDITHRHIERIEGRIYKGKRNHRREAAKQVLRNLQHAYRNVDDFWNKALNLNEIPSREYVENLLELLNSAEVYANLLDDINID